jgi:hypothetical protein
MFGGKVIILQQWHPRFIFDKTRSKIFWFGDTFILNLFLYGKRQA